MTPPRPAPCPVPRPAPRAELRISRLLTMGIGLTSVLLVLARPRAVLEPAPMPDWFAGLQLVSLLVPTMVAALAPRLDLRALRRGNAATALTSLGLVAGAGAAQLLLAPDDRHVPWLLTSLAPGALASLIAWGTRWAWALLCTATAGVQLLRWTTGDHTVGTSVNDLQALLLAIGLLALSRLLLVATREADRRWLAARATAQRHAAEAARHDARERTAALVHDEVLAPLLLASRATSPALQEAVVTHAARAHRLLKESAEPRATSPSTPEALTQQLRATVRAEDPRATYSDQVSGTLGIPPATAAALDGALRQALTNSIEHAGTGARRAVRVDITAAGVDVTIQDDGVGFDPASMPRTRMGVTVSILGRLRAQAGGSAQIDSRPGAGTTVVLRWRPPQPTRTASTPDVWLTGAAAEGTAPWRRFQTLLGVAVVAGQAGLATLAAVADPPGAWRAAVALVGGLIALGLLWDPPRRVLGTGRAAAVVALLVGPATLSWHAAASGRLDFTELWYLTGFTWVLVLLAIRGRPGSAAAGAALCGLTVAAGLAIAVPGVGAGEAGSSLARAVVVALLAALLLLGLRRTHHALLRLEATELEHLRTRTWEQARRAELMARSHAVDATIGPMLQRIATGAPLSEAERCTCVALEGRLRDHYRGGRLSRHPLVEAAMAARIRGVDVCLLDDADHRIDEPTLERIAGWLADQLDGVQAGQFVGRILPAGRDGVAGAVAGAHSAVLRLDGSAPPTAPSAAPSTGHNASRVLPAHP